MHEDHRKRMRERYLQSGFDGFADHEILEMVLYYSIPRGDTNELAHRLMERFGSIRNILEASVDELMTVDGVGPYTALQCKLSVELIRRYAKDILSVTPSYRTLSSISEYLCRKFIGCANECVYLMLLNNRLSLIDCCKVSEGTVNNSLVPIRKITETTLFRKASVLVLAHNHPNGFAVPSKSDLEVTEKIATMFNALGVPLLEHLIVADDSVYPILHGSMAESECNLPENLLRANPAFLNTFYDIDPKSWRFSFYREYLKTKQ